jgi:hypothetical protein
LKLRIGDNVITNKDITWDEGQIPEGTEGEIANIIEASRKEIYCVFNPKGTAEMYFVNIKSVNKQ